MDELKFKYDIMYLTKDRCELKRVKRKPFLKILSDIFEPSEFLFTMLLFALFMSLSGAKINYILPSVIGFLFFPLILKYYEWHTNVTVLTDNIQKIYMTKNGQIMKIEYAVPNSQWNRMRIMAIDMPDNEHEQQYLINQLNERNLFVIDKK